MKQSNFELMRILSAIAIVAFHCTNAIGLPDALSKSRLLLVSTGSWGVLGVDLFFLLSIYFMRNKEINKQKVKQIMKDVLFYSVILIVACMIWESYTNEMSITKTLRRLFYEGIQQPFFTQMYWFVSAYIFLYIMMPILHKIQGEQKTFDNKYIWGLMFCANFLPKVNLFSDFIFVMLIYFVAVDIFERENNFFERYCWQGSILCTIIIIGFRFYSPLLSEFYILQRMFANVSRYSLILLLDSLFIFYSFKKLNIGNNSIINKISKTSLAIYLFHDNSLFSLRYVITDIIKAHIDFETIATISLLVIYIAIVIGFVVAAILIEEIRSKMLGLIDKLRANR